MRVTMAGASDQRRRSRTEVNPPLDVDLLWLYLSGKDFHLNTVWERPIIGIF